MGSYKVLFFVLNRLLIINSHVRARSTMVRVPIWDFYEIPCGQDKRGVCVGARALHIQVHMVLFKT